jgi:hypothetical protein
VPPSSSADSFSSTLLAWLACTATAQTPGLSASLAFLLLLFCPLLIYFIWFGEIGISLSMTADLLINVI